MTMFRPILPALLSLLFLAGCLAPSETPPAPGNHHPMSHGEPHQAASPAVQLLLNTTPKVPAAGQPVVLRLTLTDSVSSLPVRNLETVHEQPMHLILISTDLQVFQHLHPKLVGPGQAEVKTTLPQGGAYRVYVQLTPTGGSEQTLTAGVKATGTVPAPAVWHNTIDHTQSLGPYQVQLTGTPKRAGQDAHLLLNLSRDGKPVAGIEPYLGAGGHMVVVRDNLETFLHVHPMTEPQADGTFTAPLAFHTHFDQPGHYKAWVQIHPPGMAVETVAFTFTVPQ